MMLQVGQEDEAGFERASEWLLGEFERWLRDEAGLGGEAADTVSGDVSIALDWKFRYGDGHLGRWTEGDVTEFLLGWCPRKLSVSQEDSVTIPGSFAVFGDFLAARGLLAKGSEPAAALRATATGVAGEFVAEMGDPANFGMAKTIFTAAGEYGFDPTDEAGLAEWMETFNSLSQAEREAILPDRVLGIGGPGGASADEPGWRSLPPVVLPPAEVIEESKAAARVLGAFAKLAAFVGEGRQLTKNGNLTLADARELVTLLRTGDVMDPVIGGEVFKTRSSSELPTLGLVFGWAKKSGVLRVRHGKVLATKRGLKLASEPGDMFDRALDALLTAGPLALSQRPGEWLRWPEVDEAVDAMALHFLVTPYSEQGPVRLSEMFDVATRAVRHLFRFTDISGQRVEGKVGRGVARVMECLDLAGVLRHVPMPGDEDEPFPTPVIGVELTPAGLAAVRQRLADAGYDTPVAGQLAGAPAAELMTSLDPDDWPAFSAEVAAWCQRRSTEQAVAELAGAVRQIDDLSLRNITLAIMAGIGLEEAIPHVLKLAEDRVARGSALAWLAEHGLLAERELYDPGDLDSFAEVLACRLVTSGPDGMAATLALAGDDAARIRLVGDLGRSPEPLAEEVLEAIGETHQSKVVAKAARKALFLRRSRARVS